MNKEEFKKYLEDLYQKSIKPTEGKNNYEKEMHVFHKQIYDRMFFEAIKQSIYSMPIDKVRGTKELYTETELRESRSSFIASTMATYCEKNNIKKDQFTPEFDAYRSGYYSADYDRYKDVFGQYVSKKEWDEAIGKKKLIKNGTFHHGNDMSDVLKDILKTKNVDENVKDTIVNDFANKMYPTEEEIINSTSNIVPKEIYDNNPSMQPDVILSPVNVSKKSDEYINYVLDNLDPKEYDKIKELAEKKDVQIDKPIDEIKVPKYENEINNIRKMELTKEQQEALDYIENTHVETTKDFNDDLESKRLKVESALVADENARTNEIINEKGYNIIDEYRLKTNLGGGKEDETNIYLKDETNPQKVQEYDNLEMQYSPEQQKNLVNILNKMDKYGIVSDKAVSEQAGKIYGLHQLATLNGKIDGALKQGRKEELPALVEEHKQLMKQYNEIFADIKKNFPIEGDTLAYGGNLDVARNHVFSPELRRDIPTVSHFNGLFLIGSFLKEKKIKPEEYFKNPKKVIFNQFEQYVDKLKVKPEDYKGKSPAYMIFDMQKPDYEVAPGHLAFIRVMENSANFEKDKQMKENNKLVYNTYDKQAKAYGSYANLRNANQTNSELFQRVMLVPEDQRGYNLIGEKDYDPMKMKLTDKVPFDEITYMQNNQLSLKEFNEKIKTSIKDYYDLSTEARKNPQYLQEFPVEKFVQAAHRLAIKMAVMSPDKSSKDYDELMKFVNEPQKMADEYVGKKIDYLDVELDDGKTFMEDMNDYIKKQSKKSKNVGKDQVAKDKALNNLLKNKNGYEIQNYSKEINNRKKELTEAFRKGEVSEHYYKERLEQLNNKDFKAELPAMFEYDKLPSQKDFAKKHDLEDLPKDDIKLAYERYKDKAKRDKEEFFKRQYLREEGICKNPVYTLEEMNPELKGATAIKSKEVKYFYADNEKDRDMIRGNDYLKTVSENDLDESMEEELDESQIIENEINEIEQIHVDLDEPQVENTNMLKNDGRNLKVEKNPPSNK